MYSLIKTKPFVSKKKLDNKCECMCTVLVHCFWLQPTSSTKTVKQLCHDSWIGFLSDMENNLHMYWMMQEIDYITALSSKASHLECVFVKLSSKSFYFLRKITMSTKCKSNASVCVFVYKIRILPCIKFMTHAINKCVLH